MKRWVLAVAIVVLVTLLSTLVTHGLWLNRIRRAETAFVEGRYQEAETRFKEARAAWELSILPEPLVLENRALIALNLVQIGYLFGRYQETMDFLKGEGSLAALAEKAEFHFWMGNLLMQQAASGSKANLIEILGECQGEYLEAMRKSPEFWDAKYNYEYVNAILAQFQNRQERQEPDIKLLLEHMRTDQQRRKKELPPQKRG